jgi:hypothetical protein
LEKTLVLDLKKTEVRNDCAGEGQHQFNGGSNGLAARQSPAGKSVNMEAEDIVEIRYLATTFEEITHIENLASVVEEKSST